MLGRTKLKFNVFWAVIAEIEAILNDWPLTYSILQKNPNGDFFVLSHLSIYRETVFGFFT
jgi:hypothetical protein